MAKDRDWHVAFPWTGFQRHDTLLIALRQSGAIHFQPLLTPMSSSESSGALFWHGVVTMHRLTVGFFAVLAGLSLSASYLASAHAEDDLRSKADKALKRFYAERLGQPFIITDATPEVKVGPPPWAAPIRELSSAKSEERRRAAAFLRELLVITMEQEQSRTAPWRATPYWGGGAELPSRELRKELAEALAKAGPLPDALPVWRWYLENERIDAHLEPVMTALSKLDGKDAEALRAELATRPHDNAIVAAAAINQIAEKKGSLPAEPLAALCHHHRKLIREAARKLNAQQGGKDPGAFAPAKAVRSKPMEKLMGQVGELMTELPAPKAEFVKLTERYLDAKKVVKQTYEHVGWLTRRESDIIEIYTLYGQLDAVRDKEQKRVEHHERLPDGNGTRFSEIDITVDAAVTPARLDDVIKQVEASRAKNTAGNDLSESGPLTGQFRGTGATLFEAILGTWLYQAGQDAEAARVLLPALDSLYADRHLVDMVRHQLGQIHGYRMLVAFAGDRDYEKALRSARLIDERYPDTRFHEYAKGFVKQFPRRVDDFKKFKLPTAAEWGTLKQKLTRTEQIDFLCERMRLLNCFQSGQPGGYDPDAEQFAEPCGMASDASWGLRKGKTLVINPLTELKGPYNWFDENKPKPRGMELTLKDVPQLGRYLRDDWYMPTVGFWRDFHPDRNLAGTRQWFAQVINGLAGKDICKIAGWTHLTPAEIDKEIERISQWATENAGKSKVQLQWDALREIVKAGGNWHAVQDRVGWLLEHKETDAYGVMKTYLHDDTTDDWSKGQILQLYLKHDPAQARELAPGFLNHKQSYLSFYAALIVFQTGDRDKARHILGEALATAEIDGWLADAVDQLLKEGSSESKQQVVRVFSNRRFRHERYSRVKILQSCARAGMKEPYEFYIPLLDISDSVLPMLDEKGKPSGASNFEPSVAAAFAKEIVDQFAKDDPAVKEIARKHPRTADQLADLKNWLRSRVAPAQPR
jgi:hypothetical protein